MFNENLILLISSFQSKANNVLQNSPNHEYLCCQKTPILKNCPTFGHAYQTIFIGRFK